MNISPSTSNTSSAWLSARNLTRRFGALAAVSDVNLDLHGDQIHAVIGTNGAGKSTLINLLSGELPASAGQVMLDGRDITRWSQPRRAQAGLGRSYQRNNIFLPLSVRENCRLSAQIHHQKPWCVWESAQHCRWSTQRADEAMERAGLSAMADHPAASLSHGQKRQLEVAMCLATQPRVLLLDEPLAGMGPEESQRMLNLLRELRSGHAILLVEHDMDAVFAVADRITVMVNGSVLASGCPEDVRANSDVQAAYLGEH
ncbi:MAG: ABC transporter ATP-binding protein [Caldimonas sp.]|uniref:ABC transporter ATP-binding protein n=1 Tax=Caldimonas taiwanensis TaxID=307483 RepID=UPI0007866331|nr:ABC transporter ATP-binding protein [Caldimonas taiwanensis]GIX25656.1 MAG: ABC transporter ATP-binding protein [Caldimonas sp.]